VSPPLTAGLFVNPEGSHPKPTISVSPAGVIPVGENVTIRCRHQRLGIRILLYKDGDWNYLNYMDPAVSEAEFPITSAKREQSGNYTCRYSHRTGSSAHSEPSDPVQIIVAGEGPSPAPRLPAPHPARAQGVSVGPGPSRGDAWPGSGDGVSGGFPSQGEQQPLETRGREATLTLPLVRRNRESLFNPVIPSPLFSRPWPS
uniref:Ig-like domain-containing protein n=1 Tax=Chelydra serpentina TaxID=8475 RepID=A0A8C3S4G8_CHESE